MTRRLALERDDWTCQDCGGWGDEVDHIKPVHQGGAKWELDNLQVLCPDCHIKKTRRDMPGYTEGRNEWLDALGERYGY